MSQPIYFFMAVAAPPTRLGGDYTPPGGSAHIQSQKSLRNICRTISDLAKLRARSGQFLLYTMVNPPDAVGRPCLPRGVRVGD
jgi:hypothetical protein